VVANHLGTQRDSTNATSDAMKMNIKMKYLILFSIAACFLIVKLAFGPDFAAYLLLIAMLLTLATGLLLGALWWARKIGLPSKWKCYRLLRWMRNSVKSPPTSNIFYFLSLFMAIVVFIFKIALYNDLVICFAALMIVFLILACLLDWWFRIKYLLRFRIVGRILKVLGAVISISTIFMATIISEHLVYAVTHFESKFTGNFYKLITFAVTPVALLAVLLIFFSIIFIFQFLVFMVFSILNNSFLAILANFMPQKALGWRDALRRFWTGKKKVVKIGWWEYACDGVPYFFRPFGTLVLIGILAFSLSLVNVSNPAFLSVLTKALLFIEYRTGSNCMGLPKDAKILYLDRGLISVADKSAGTYTFSIRKCDYNIAP
jgi:hypothetical protein